MTRDIIRDRILDAAAIAVIRLDEPADGERVGEALLRGGVSILEVTMTSPNALDLISRLAAAFATDVLVGVGSVLDRAMALSAIDAGARFVVSPVLIPDVIHEAHENGVPVLAGAFSPTEIQYAYTLGADLIKVFPADVVGMSYFKSIRAPMPHLQLVPTGGVTLDNAGDWLRAGAAAVGVGSALVDKNAIASKQFDVLTENGRRLMTSINSYRNG
jgi:2-dehydro-3-deoxyphosphogluconate aldolase/(4S)-4-hydroxy-2-oxoglutarate aldolase